MGSLSIILRSLLVFVGLAVLFVPLAFIRPDAITAQNAETIRIDEKTQMAALSPAK